MTIVLAMCTIQCQAHLLRLTPTELNEVSESGREEYAIFAVIALANGPDRRPNLGKQKTVKVRQISDLLKSFVRANKVCNASLATWSIVLRACCMNGNGQTR